MSEDIGTEVFEAVYTDLADCRAQVRVDAYIIERAVTSGRMITKESGEQGTYLPAEMTVRLLASDEDANFPLTVGNKIEVKHVDADGWVMLRIAGRKSIGGILSLTLDIPYE